MAKQDEYLRITVRLPPELHEKLRQAAQATSINAEIVTRLESSFAPRIAAGAGRAEGKSNAQGAGVDLPAQPIDLEQMMERALEAALRKTLSAKMLAN